jgi:hypothetical protein
MSSGIVITEETWLAGTISTHYKIYVYSWGVRTTQYVIALIVFLCKSFLCLCQSLLDVSLADVGGDESLLEYGSG